MAVKSFSAQYWAAKYFRPVWFAEADDTHLTDEERHSGGPDSSSGPRTWRDDDDSEYEKSFERYRKSVYSKTESANYSETEQEPLVEFSLEIPVSVVEEAPLPIVSLAPAQDALIETSIAKEKLAEALQNARRRKDDEEAFLFLIMD